MDVRTHFVHHVDSLVWEVAVVDVSVAQLHACLQSLVGEIYVMMLLVLFLDVMQNLQGGFCRSWFNDYLLESSLQGTILLNTLAVLVKSGGSDALQGATCQGWFQNIGSIHRTLSASSSYHRMNLINEEDDVLVLLQFLDYALDALLKLTSELGSGNESCQVETHDTLVEEERAVVAALLAKHLGKTFDDGTLTYARFTNQNRIVLLASAQDFHHSADFLVSSHHRVELAVFGSLGQVVAKLVKEWRIRLGALFAAGTNHVRFGVAHGVRAVAPVVSIAIRVFIAEVEWFLVRVHQVACLVLKV